MILDIIIIIDNLEKNIESLYNKLIDELKNIKYNIIFIDNGSNDKSLDILKNLQKKNESIIKIISLSKKHDKDTCFFAGIKNSTNNFICLFDIENNNQFSQIIKMYDYINKHKEYDQICIESNYKENNIFKKIKLSIFNKLYGLKFNNKTFTRIINRNVANAIIEYTKYKPFSIYTFEDIGFNTFFIKTDTNNIEKINYKKLINYSKNKYLILNTINFILLTISFFYLIFNLLNVFDINNNILLLFVLLSNCLNIFIQVLCNKKKDKTFFFIKEKIGFEDNIL